MNDVGERVGDRKLPVVAEHRDELHEALEAFAGHRVGERVKRLGAAMLQDLREDLEQRRPGLHVAAVGET